MNQNLWLKFWLVAHDPVYYQGQQYVDLTLFPIEEYPALSQLTDTPTLEILILACLITSIKTLPPGFNDIYLDFLFEMFENYDCSKLDIDAALTNLHNKRWVEFLVDEKRNEFIYEADLLELTKAGLYIPDNEITTKLVTELSVN